MKFAPLALTFLLVSSLWLATQAQAPAASQSIIRGLVFAEDTGRPMRRTRVILFRANNKASQRIAVTDEQGQFLFSNVAAVEYRIAVDAPGGISMDNFLALEDALNEPPTVVVDGTSQREIEVRGRRGGAISGRFTYADGEPVINAKISVLRKRHEHWVAVNLGSSGLHTDDRGYYRAFGLPPGEYLVRAIEQKTLITEYEGRTGYTTSYATLRPFTILPV